MSPPAPRPRRILFVTIGLLGLLGLAVGLSLEPNISAKAQTVEATVVPLPAVREAPPHGDDVGIRLRALAETPADTPTVTDTPTNTPTVTPTPSPSSTATPSQSPTATATETPAGGRTYLPLLLRQLPLPATPTPTLTPTPTPTGTSTPPVTRGIYGRLTYYGTPSAGIGLTLRFYNGASWSAVATTTTDTNGRYVFPDAPTLLAGQKYYVLFGLNTVAPQYLGSWHGPDILSYISGLVTSGGDFDIANVTLVSPDTNAARSLPAQFTWQPRRLGAEGYRWRLLDPASGAAWTSGDLGDVGSFVLNGLPAGVVYGKWYRWYVEVYAGPGNYGSSFYYRWISFTQTGVARAGSEAWPPPELERSELPDLLPVSEQTGH
jgi:hypothetical protein